MHEQSPEISENSLAYKPGVFPKIDFLDYLLYVVFALSFFSVLVVFDFIQRVSWAISARLHERSVFHMNCWLRRTLYIINAKVEVTFENAKPPAGQIIVVSNHQSLFDIVLSTIIFDSNRPKFIGKKELSKGIPSVSFNLTRNGNTTIDRKNPRKAITGIKKIAEVLAVSKASPVIFPEGTRSRNGAMIAFRPAGISLLLDILKDAPIVPITFENSWITQSKKFGPVPRGITIKVLVSAPIERSENASSKELISALETIIAKNLSKMRHADS